jgi:hypothetical protein
MPDRRPPHGFPPNSPAWMEWQEDIRQTSASSFTGILPVANGGTGSASAGGARGNLGAYGAGDSATFLTVQVDDEAYDATGWNADLTVPTKNAVRDKIESLSIPVASDVAYDATTWNANTDVPTKNVVRDKFESLPVLDAGTYTPTSTDDTNVDDSTTFQCQYLRVGATVTVSGKVEIDSTAGTTLTRVDLSLPVASDFGATEDAAGTASTNDGLSGIIYADAANNRVSLEFTETTAGVKMFYFHFTYQVI